MNKYTIKDGEFFTYDHDQDALYKNRIEKDGHIPATHKDVDALIQPPVTSGALKAAITQKRWEVETGGITLPTGVSVATGIDDQNRITSVVANAERAGLEQVDFKAAEGWFKVTLDELREIAIAVALHVQACFSAERAHHEAIDAIDAQLAANHEALSDALNAYDISAGWPTRQATQLSNF